MDLDKEHAQVLWSFKARLHSENGKQFKFGIQLARNPKHTLQLDKENRTTGWANSICKELDEIMSHDTFQVIPDGDPTPKGHVRILHHIVYDVKFDQRLKSRLVAGEHRSPDVHSRDCHASVVLLEVGRLRFTVAKLNGLQVCAGDIGNAHLNAKTNEKLFIIAGSEFGPELAGK